MNKKAGKKPHWPVADEKAYWTMRRGLLRRYKGRWVAISNTRLIADAANMRELSDLVYEKAPKVSPFMTVVGEEEKAVVRIRRNCSFKYDRTYDPDLPRIRATFCNNSRTKSRRYFDVIPDTGSDITCLPARDCGRMGLDEVPPRWVYSQRVGEKRTGVALYPAYVEIGKAEYRLLVEALDWPERLLGRDVLNKMVALFDGPRRIVTLKTASTKVSRPIVKK